LNALVNGEWADTVAIRDRGLAYGDGVFRTLRCEAASLWCWPRHYAKLVADCAALGLACPAEPLLLADIARLAPQHAVVKITVTRGDGQRGYACDPAQPVRRIVQCSPLPHYADSLYTLGASVRRCDWLLGVQPGLAGVKHLNRLDQVMARREWDDPGLFDGLMCNARGELVEGVISNLFLLCGQTLRTHPLADCGVAGVARSLVLDLAASLGFALDLRPPVWDELTAADEVFLCNSLAGVVPVGRLGEIAWPAFPQTLRLRDAWLARAKEESRPCCAV
jgi:4-amino-4-deoxychorismate lyase